MADNLREALKTMGRSDPDPAAPAPAAAITACPEFFVLNPDGFTATLGLAAPDWIDLEQRGLIRLVRVRPEGVAAEVVLLPGPEARIALHRLARTATTEPSAAVLASKPDASSTTPPDIAPGVSLAGYHGKAWPTVLTVKVTSVVPAQTPTGKPLIKLGIECEGYTGDVFTFEGVELREENGAKVTAITNPFLKAGEFVEANFTAKLCPSKIKDEAGNPKPDYGRAPALFVRNIVPSPNQPPFSTMTELFAERPMPRMF